MVRRVPPSHRLAPCCGTCEHWSWGYEGEGQCHRYPESRTVKRRKGELAGEEDIVHHYVGSATSICDDWKGRSK